MFVLDRYSGKIKKFVKSEKGNNFFSQNLIIPEAVYCQKAKVLQKKFFLMEQ